MKKDPTTCCLQEIYVKYKDANSFKGKGGGKDANMNHKKAAVTMLVSDHANLKTKSIFRNRDISN